MVITFFGSAMTINAQVVSAKEKNIFVGFKALPIYTHPWFYTPLASSDACIEKNQ
jgi:hypothetical protein